MVLPIIISTNPLRAVLCNEQRLVSLYLIGMLIVPEEVVARRVDS